LKLSQIRKIGGINSYLQFLAICADGAKVSLGILNECLVRQILLTSRAVEAIFVEFVGVHDEKLSSWGDRLSATAQRTAFRKLVQMAIRTIRSFILDAESDVGQQSFTSFAGETKFVERSATMLHPAFTSNNRLGAFVASRGNILLITVVTVMFFCVHRIVDEPLRSGDVLCADLANEAVRVVLETLVFGKISAPIDRLVAFNAVSDRHFIPGSYREKKSGLFTEKKCFN